MRSRSRGTEGRGRAGRRAPWTCGLFIVTALLMAACGSSSTATTEERNDRGGRGRERVRRTSRRRSAASTSRVTSIESNPNTDPHTYEVSPGVAQAVERGPARRPERGGLRRLHDQDRIGIPEPERGVSSTCSTSSGLPDSTPNPHLWYSPDDHAEGGRRPGRRPARPCSRHTRPISGTTPRASSRRSTRGCRRSPVSRPPTPNTEVATTEPVADYMLEAAGTDNLTPFTFQADIMNGVDPSPQDVSFQTGLFTQHKVKVFVYNQQVTDSLTQTLHQRRAPRPAFRSSGSTRRCPSPAMTISPGCWPRSGPAACGRPTRSRP